MRAVHLSLLVLLLSGGFLRGEEPTPFPEPTSARSLFADRPFGPLPPPTPTPSARALVPPSKPIPQAWWIGGGVAAAVLLIALAYGTIRAARKANLFDRQYRLPPPENVTLRLGGTRCGGHLAKISFKGRTPPRTSARKGA